ncbi:hypothetical protein PIB30_105659, partial [Stylosanthes scabra]|nr:hypothetical protein [Stylosanthes scabra]
MVINVFKAMQYSGEEDAENCMRVDVIDMLIKEIQEEDTMLKPQAKYEERFDVLGETNLKSVLQEKEDATLEEKPNMELKPLPTTLKYAFLGNDKNLPIFISSSLNTQQEEELLMVLREQKL